MTVHAPAVSRCPRCHAPLAGLATFCHDCGGYVADLLDGEPPAQDATPAPPDTRSEADIRMAVRSALDVLGFTVLDLEQGFRRDGSTRVRRGLPDLYVMGFGVGVWRELKSATGRLTPAQEAFGEDCRRAGVDWGVWRSEAEAIEWARGVRGLDA